MVYGFATFVHFSASVPLQSVLLTEVYLFRSFCFQIRVVNAFQEPANAPSNLPHIARPSFASLIAAATAAEAAKAAEAARAEAAKAGSRDEAGGRGRESETCV